MSGLGYHKLDNHKFQPEEWAGEQRRHTRVKWNPATSVECWGAPWVSSPQFIECKWKDRIILTGYIGVFFGAEPASQYLVAIYCSGKYHWKCELDKMLFIKMLWEKYSDKTFRGQWRVKPPQRAWNLRCAENRLPRRIKLGPPRTCSAGWELVCWAESSVAPPKNRSPTLVSQPLSPTFLYARFSLFLILLKNCYFYATLLLNYC